VAAPTARPDINGNACVLDEMLWLGDTLLRGRERDRSWQPSAAWIGRDWQRRRRTKFPQRRCGDRSFISLLLAQTNAFEPNSNAVSGAPSDCVLHKSLAAGCLKLGDRYDAVPVGVDLSEVYDVRRGVSLSQRVAAWHRLLPYLLALCVGQNSGRAAGRHGVPWARAYPAPTSSTMVVNGRILILLPPTLSVALQSLTADPANR